MKKEHKDLERCKKCRGACCLIYQSVHDGGSRPIGTWFEDWVNEWDDEFETCGATKSGIEPLFDPLLVHLTGNEYILKDLKKKGIDPYKCKYCSQDGCLLSRKDRPKNCRTFRCQDWRAK